MAHRIIGAEEGVRLCELVRSSSSWDRVLVEFEAEFGWRIKRETAQSYTSRHGVKLADGKVRWELHPEYDEFLRGYVPGRSQREVIDGFERQFGIRLRTAQLKGRQEVIGLRSGTVGGRFAPGSVPANKGLKMADFVMDEAKLANIRRCQFRKGQEAHNECAVGTEREGKDGYIEVKVPSEDAEDRANGRWVAKQRVVWERANGRRLRKGEGVMFGDRDNRNFDPDNLVAVTQAERLYINRHAIPYRDAESLRAAVAMARLNEAIVSAELRPRQCRCCGRTFTPQYKGQRTCRECLDAGRRAGRSYGTGTCERCGAAYNRTSPRAKFCPRCRGGKYRKEQGNG